MRSHVLVYLVPALIPAAIWPAPAARPAPAQEPAPVPQLTSPSIADAKPEPSSHLPTATTHPVTTPTAAPVYVADPKPANLTSSDVDFSQITEEDVRIKAETIDKTLATIDF